ncbi:uncharacterized protein LOC143855052 isoform X2 [Tasmannia lanceolata]|uniref:uncharacterized protein LOC143855052 isoform X2 n=1 Tax=Tasmannia lanceolata TaxID=3420 RepID=UPI004063DCAB
MYIWPESLRSESEGFTRSVRLSLRMDRDARTMPEGGAQAKKGHGSDSYAAGPPQMGAYRTQRPARASKWASFLDRAETSSSSMKRGKTGGRFHANLPFNSEERIAEALHTTDLFIQLQRVLYESYLWGGIRDGTPWRYQRARIDLGLTSTYEVSVPVYIHRVDDPPADPPVPEA